MLTGMTSDAIKVETQSVSAKTALQPDDVDGDPWITVDEDGKNGQAGDRH